MKIIEKDGIITGGITDESNFDKLVKKLMKENGYSEDRAKRIAYSIGVKKYGKAGMTAKSVAGRKDAVSEMDSATPTNTPTPIITGDFITDEEMESISEMEDDYIGWDKLVKELMAKGHSKKSAENIAATIGRKKYGAAGMAAKAAAGRDSESVDDSEITPILQAEGKHTGTDYSQYDPKELALGILVEKEHADDPIDRMEIASDHLEEKQNYYSDPSSFFLSELRKEYGDKLVPEYQKALEYVNKVVSGEVPTQDADINTVVLEAAATPVIKKLMQAMGFKKLFWKGSGWVIPIGLDEYGNYLKMIPRLKIYDAMLQKFGYEISLSPGWFKIVPVEKSRMHDALTAEQYVETMKKYNAEVDRAEKALKKVIAGNRNSMGLVNENVKKSSEYQKAKRDFNIAFEKSRRFAATVPNDVKREASRIRRGLR